jgi:hypothetical protein
VEGQVEAVEEVFQPSDFDPVARLYDVGVIVNPESSGSPERDRCASRQQVSTVLGDQKEVPIEEKLVDIVDDS